MVSIKGYKVSSLWPYRYKCERCSAVCIEHGSNVVIGDSEEPSCMRWCECGGLALIESDVEE